MKNVVDIDAYLARIGLTQCPKADAEGLAILQRAHMRTVPFENLDVFIGRPLSLCVQDLFEKIVVSKRGGYCFELNTLYGVLLMAIGFEITPILARVWLRDSVDVPARSHMTHLVNIDGHQYITDVGFGGRTSLVPLAIEGGQPVSDGDGLIRIHPDGNFGYILQRQLGGQWETQFSFTTDRVYPADILVANHFTETHENSHFRHARYVGHFRVLGRNGLADTQLTIREQNDIKTQSLSLDKEWEACLKTRFGLVLDLTTKERLKLFST